MTTASDEVNAPHILLLFVPILRNFDGIIYPLVREF